MQAQPNGLTKALSNNNFIFIIYIIYLVVGIVFTVLLFKSSNKVQDAIKKESEAKIAIANVNAELARKDAAIANEKATEAKTIQQRVEIELAQQRERAAKAESSLLRLHEQLTQRTFSDIDKKHLITILKNCVEKARIPVICDGSSETLTFARQIQDILKKAGWDTDESPSIATPSWEGIVLTVDDPVNPPISAKLLASELAKLGYNVTITARGRVGFKTLTGSKSLSISNQKLVLLNLLVGEKSRIK